MENLKIRVNSEAESKEAQELFLGLGYVKENWLWSGYGDYPIELRTRDGGYSDFNLNAGNAIKRKEITLPELRAMVNPMKEYLDKKPDGSYELITASSGCVDRDWIEIPEGAVKFIFSKENCGNYHFANESNQLMPLTDINNGLSAWHKGTEDYMTKCKVDVLWQREQDEPFLTPECTLNDQYAEIEQVRQAIKVKSGSDSDHALDAMSFGFMGVGSAQASGGIDATLAQRQSTYGNFEDVAFVTENIMSILGRVRVNGLSELPNTHRMALYMIASKMARIVNGDFNFIESWHDISGYAKLIENELMQTDGATNSRVVYQVVKDGVLEDKNES